MEISSKSLLKLAGHLAQFDAEKLAVHLEIDHKHIATMRQQYPHDPEMFAYKLLLRWWEEGVEDEQEAHGALVCALKEVGLVSIAAIMEGSATDRSRGE